VSTVLILERGASTDKRLSYAVQSIGDVVAHDVVSADVERKSRWLAITDEHNLRRGLQAEGDAKFKQNIRVGEGQVGDKNVASENLEYDLLGKFKSALGTSNADGIVERAKAWRSECVCSPSRWDKDFIEDRARTVSM
jgi:hypothetical protein